jgi:nitrate/nitrite-specific signal transduction histidine kinase
MSAAKAKDRPIKKKKATSRKKSVAALLHDTVAQELTASTILAHVLATRLENEGHPQAATAADLAEKLNLASQQLREIMMELAPS